MHKLSSLVKLSDFQLWYPKTVAPKPSFSRECSRGMTVQQCKSFKLLLRNTTIIEVDTEQSDKPNRLLSVTLHVLHLFQPHKLCIVDLGKVITWRREIVFKYINDSPSLLTRSIAYIYSNMYL